MSGAVYVKIEKKALEETGEIKIISEPLTVEEIIGTVGMAPKGGFEITRLNLLFEVIDIIKGKGSGEVIKYLFKSKSVNNIIYGSISSIAKKTGVSRKTVGEILLRLKEKEVIKIRGRTIMLNPSLLHKGDARREGYLFKKFSEIKEDVNIIDENDFGKPDDIIDK